jgi:hypothetical protein
MVTTVVANSEGLVDKTVFDSQPKTVIEDS